MKRFVAALLSVLLCAPVVGATLGGLASLGGQASVGPTATGGGANLITMPTGANKEFTVNATRPCFGESSALCTDSNSQGDESIGITSQGKIFLPYFEKSPTAAGEDKRIMLAWWDTGLISGTPSTSLGHCVVHATVGGGNEQHMPATVFIPEFGPNKDKLYVVFGGSDSECAPYQCYKVSTNANDCSSFGSLLLTPSVDVSNVTGFAVGSVIYFTGESGAGQNGFFKLDTSTGTWNIDNGTFIQNPNNSTNGSYKPASITRSPDGTRFYMQWTTGDSAGCTRQLFGAKSTDAAATWTDFAGNNSVTSTSVPAFTRTTTLTACGGGTGTMNIFGNHRIHAENLSTAAGVIREHPLTNAGYSMDLQNNSEVYLRTWNGSAWTTVRNVTDAAADNSKFFLDAAYCIAPDGTHAIWASDADNIYQYTATDPTQSWSRSVFKTADASATNFSQIQCRSWTPGGANSSGILVRYGEWFGSASDTDDRYTKGWFDWLPFGEAPPSIALVSTAAGGSSNAQTVDLASINTTGASFGGLCTSSAGSLTISDNRGGTWTEQISQGASTEARFWTRSGGTFGTDTIVSVTNNGTRYPAAVVAFYSGVSSIGTPVSGANESGTTVQPGSVTPGAAANLLISCLATGAASGTISINSGYTKRGDVSYVDGQHLTVALADLIQSAATAQNPTWTVTSSSVLRSTHVAAQ